jgi:probable HAF family extracellular repeat protein
VYTVVFGIDDSGRIVGVSATGSASGNRMVRGFLRDAQGGFAPIEVPNAAGTVAFDINSRGQIVGGYFDDLRRHGFLLSDGVFTTLTVPGAFLDPIALGINDQGRIVGAYQ